MVRFGGAGIPLSLLREGIFLDLSLGLLGEENRAPDMRFAQKVHP